MKVPEPLRTRGAEALDRAYARATDAGATPITPADTALEVASIVRNGQQGGTRLLLACSLAAATDPTLDVLRPFIKVGGPAYNGRMVDEGLVSPFVEQHRLPTMVSTAFTSRGLARGDNVLAVTGVAALYRPTVVLLEQVAAGRLGADDLLAETIRALLVVRQEQEAEIAALERAASAERVVPATEEIINLLREHQAAPSTSRLPVLAAAAAYVAASPEAGWNVKPLRGHFAADKQTGALGDIEVERADTRVLQNVLDGKDKEVDSKDLADAARKAAAGKVDAYFILTTKPISDAIAREARARSAASEIVVRDWLEHIRAILFLFPSARGRFLDEYQRLVMSDHQVGLPVRSSFLRLRQARFSRQTA